MAKTVYINIANGLFYQYASNRKCIFLKTTGFYDYYLRLKDIKPFKQMIYKLYKKSIKLQNDENSFICKAYGQNINVSAFTPNEKLFFYSRIAQISKKEIGFCILQNPPKMTYSLVGIYTKDQSEFNINNVIMLSKRKILRILKFLTKIENFINYGKNKIYI